MFEAFMRGICELYGNYAILALVCDNTISREELVKRVYQTKINLRNKYSKPSLVGIVTNSDQFENAEIKPKRKLRNKIKMIDFTGKSKKPKYMGSIGEYRLHYMNLIHSPDPDIQTTDEEIRILVENDCLRNNLIMSRDDVDIAGFYRTFGVVRKYDVPAKPKRKIDGNTPEGH